MTIVEDRRAITGGVDSHADTHVAAALDPIGDCSALRSSRPPRPGTPACSAGWAGSGPSPWSAWRAPAVTARAWLGTWPPRAAPDTATDTAIVSAAHHAIDALARVAAADMDAVDAAARAGRLYVPTRSLPDDHDVPRAFATAPVDRSVALREAYNAVARANQEAARALDSLAVAAGAPSKTLALARSASVQSRRRGQSTRHEYDDPGRTGRADAAAGRPGPVEQAVRELRVSDPVVLLRAAAIDKAARNLLTEAELMMAPSGPSGTAQSVRDTAAGAVRLAVQSFPPARPSEGIGRDARHVQSGSQPPGITRQAGAGKPLVRRRTP